MKHLYVKAVGIFLVIASLGLLRGTPCPAASTKKLSSPIKGLIETRVPVRRNFTLMCPWVGRVECKKILRVTALTDGEIVTIKVADETPVKRGTLLFTLGGPRVEGRLTSLTAKVASLKREVALARKTVAVEEEGVRYRLTRKSSLLKAKTRLGHLQGALIRAEDGLASYRRSLVIRARMDGLFTGRNVSRGQEVQKGDVLCEIVSLKTLRIAATLFPPQDVHLTGLPAIIRTANGLNVTASVAAVLPEHTKKGATRVWIEGKAINHTFHPGECVSGNLILKIQKGVLAVPVSAIIRDQEERPFVFIKGPRGYSKRPVKLGPASGGYVGILRGIQPADRVVIHGGYELFYRQFNKIYKAAD